MLRTPSSDESKCSLWGPALEYLSVDNIYRDVLPNVYLGVPCVEMGRRMFQIVHQDHDPIELAYSRHGFPVWCSIQRNPGGALQRSIPVAGHVE